MNILVIILNVFIILSVEFYLTVNNIILYNCIQFPIFIMLFGLCLATYGVVNLPSCIKITKIL